MIAFSIDYTIRGKNMQYPRSISIEARDLKSAKRKIGKKNGYKDGRMVEIHNVIICGYF
jgi:hypothetical protein